MHEPYENIKIWCKIGSLSYRMRVLIESDQYFLCNIIIIIAIVLHVIQTIQPNCEKSLKKSVTIGKRT